MLAILAWAMHDTTYVKRGGNNRSRLRSESMSLCCIFSWGDRKLLIFCHHLKIIFMHFSIHYINYNSIFQNVSYETSGATLISHIPITSGPTLLRHPLAHPKRRRKSRPDVFKKSEWKNKGRECGEKCII